MVSRTSRSANFPSIVTVVICVAALYFARAVLVPIALAIFFAFLLAPMVSLLEKAHLGRTGPIILVVFLATSLLVGAGWLVFDQALGLAAQIPDYRETISAKIESLRGVRNNRISRVEDTVKELGNELSSSIGGSSASETNPKDARGKRGSLTSGGTANPVAVHVISEPNPLESFRAFVGPFLGPSATIGIVIVFTLFILLRREDLRERLHMLGGLSSFHVTTQAFDEATKRVGKYLFWQFVVNFSFGLLFGIALYLIGVPNALLWGVLAGLLRFIPYIGTIVGAAMPFLLSLAVFDGWHKPLLVVAVFVVLEILIGYVVEPLLYATQAGISSLAILVSAIFWAALWGPVGLLLSTPLTVCLVVLGRYIPQWEFIAVLLGDKSSLGIDVQLYQKLLNMDTDGAREVVDKFLQEASIEKLYETVITPVLIFARKDRKQFSLGEDREHFLFQALKEMIEDLASQPNNAANPAESHIRAADSFPSHLGISCISASDEEDEILSMMLAHLLIRVGYNAHAIEAGPLDEVLEEVLEQDGKMIYFSTLPPYPVFKVRRLYKKVHSRFPGQKVCIGLWGYGGNLEAMKKRLEIAESDSIITTLSEGINQITSLVEPVPQQP